MSQVYLFGSTFGSPMSHTTSQVSHFVPCLKARISQVYLFGSTFGSPMSHTTRQVSHFVSCLKARISRVYLIGSRVIFLDETFSSSSSSNFLFSFIKLFYNTILLYITTNLFHYQFRVLLIRPGEFFCLFLLLLTIKAYILVEMAFQL